MNRLSDTKIRSIKNAGRYADGGGLFLQVSDTGTKSWLYRFRFADRRREMGLGQYPRIGLADARRLASQARALLVQ